jgi:DNA replication protein DnaC
MTEQRTNWDQVLRDFERDEHMRAAEAGLTREQYIEQLRVEELATKRAQQARDAATIRARRVEPMRAALEQEMLDHIVADTLPRTKALAVTQRWSRNPNSPPYLILVGDTGTGKSTAAGDLLASMGGEYITALHLAKRHDPYWHEQKRGIVPLDVQRPELLILDDLGTEKHNASGEPDPRFMPALYEILNERMGATWKGEHLVPRRTLITANMSKEAFLEEYAKEPRIRSRLEHTRRVFIYSCGSDDMRRSTEEAAQ